MSTQESDDRGSDNRRSAALPHRAHRWVTVHTFDGVHADHTVCTVTVAPTGDAATPVAVTPEPANTPVRAVGVPTGGGGRLRTGSRVAVALMSAAVLVLTGIGWAAQEHLDMVVSDALTGAPVAGGEAFTVLLVGLDARTDTAGNPLPPALLDALHAGPDEGQLATDTIILLHVPAAASSAPAVAVSIPRDSYVPITGGRGTHKINSAYRRGLADVEAVLRERGVRGAELDRRGREGGRRVLVATVEALVGVRVDHLAEINLAGFVELSDTLGGVPVCLNAAVSDSRSGVDLPAGLQRVSGAAALAFVRQRHGLDGGDLDRIARQQAFISGLAQQLESSGALTDPARLARLIGVLTRHVVIDRGWDLKEATAQLRRLAGDELSFRTIPTGRPDLSTPVDGVAVEIEPAQVRAFVSDLVSGREPATPSTPTPSSTATTPPTATTQPTATTPPTSPPPSRRPITANGITCVD